MRLCWERRSAAHAPYATRGHIREGVGRGPGVQAVGGPHGMTGPARSFTRGTRTPPVVIKHERGAAAIVTL